VLHRDRTLLYAAAFVRAVATGMVGVVFGLFLASAGLDPSRIGYVIGAGLAGGATATAIAAFAGERLGRRRLLVSLSLLAAAGAVATAALAAWTAGADAKTVLLAGTAFFGMLNGMGRDRGAALAIEQAILPATAGERERTRVIAWYNVLQDVGHAVGSLLAGLPELLRQLTAMGWLDSTRVPLVVFAALMVATVPLYLRLSRELVATAGKKSAPVSPESRRIVTRISALFALDSLGGGFLTTALLSYFFFERFGAGEGVIGLLFFGARIANALSHLGAAWLAGRIGLVNTMVFTHIPSSLLLVTVAFAPSFGVAAALFLLREGLVEMDVPTRQSYVMAVVQPAERMWASGVTGLVRSGAWAVAPAFAGLLMERVAFATPLFIGAGLKIVYDVALYRAFRKIRPPEEQ
jgi:MFS family permease